MTDACLSLHRGPHLCDLVLEQVALDLHACDGPGMPGLIHGKSRVSVRYSYPYTARCCDKRAVYLRHFYTTPEAPHASISNVRPLHAVRRAHVRYIFRFIELSAELKRNFLPLEAVSTFFMITRILLTLTNWQP